MVDALDRLVILGGYKLNGKVEMSGAKNAVLPIMAASILKGSESVIHNVPELEDVNVMIDVLKGVGAQVGREGTTLIIDSSSVNSQAVSDSLVRKMRASNLIMGSLAGRFGSFRTVYPGGCNIGSRPIDLHLKGFEALGIEVIEENGAIMGKKKRSVEDTVVYLDFPSVGATENIMMAASLSEGYTEIRNAAREPEIVDLQNYLNLMGASVTGAGMDVIKIRGVRKFNNKSIEYDIMPDRVEAGTYMAAALITGGEIEINNVCVEHLKSLIFKLRECGAAIEIKYKVGSLRVVAPCRIGAANFKTQPYPGFPTDMQPQALALMSVADGNSLITETMFEERFRHVDELRRMGAEISVKGNTAFVCGRKKLKGSLVKASDLRAGAALVLAGLSACDATVIEDVYHIDRGYSAWDSKFSSLGAQIYRINGSLSSVQ